jgi:hypothetical protein
MTLEGLLAIAQYCRCLKSLLLVDCRNLAEEGVLAVMRDCSSLENLQVRGSTGLARRTMRAIEERFPCDDEEDVLCAY